MELFRIIKSDTKRAMQFCGGRAIASVMIFALAYLVINLTEAVLLFIFSGAESLYYDFYSFAEASPETLAITGGAAVVYLFVIPALSLGYTKLHLAFAEGKDESIVVLFDMFSSFKNFFGSVFFAIFAFARYLIAFAVSILPGGAFFWFAQNYIPSETRTAGILKIFASCVAISIMVLCVGLCMIFVQRWALAPYYLVSGNGIHKSFALSAKATKGLCTEIIAFKFSFVGWGILSFFVLPLLWSVPYYFLSNAIYSKYLMERYERSLAETPDFFETGISGEEKD